MCNKTYSEEGEYSEYMKFQIATCDEFIRPYFIQSVVNFLI